jgi:hypothetical protein
LALEPVRALFFDCSSHTIKKSALDNGVGPFIKGHSLSQVGGEGLNEITMQGQSFAQAHLLKSWHDSIDGLDLYFKNIQVNVIIGLFQSPSFRFSVGSIQYKKRIFLKTEHSKLFFTGLFAKVL